MNTLHPYARLVRVGTSLALNDAKELLTKYLHRNNLDDYSSQLQEALGAQTYTALAVRLLQREPCTAQHEYVGIAVRSLDTLVTHVQSTAHVFASKIDTGACWYG